MEEAEDETNPREFGGEVDAMSRVREVKQHIISGARYMKKRSTYSDL